MCTYCATMRMHFHQLFSRQILCTVQYRALPLTLGSIDHCGVLRHSSIIQLLFEELPDYSAFLWNHLYIWDLKQLRGCRSARCFIPSTYLSLWIHLISRVMRRHLYELLIYCRYNVKYMLAYNCTLHQMDPMKCIRLTRLWKLGWNSQETIGIKEFCVKVSKQQLPCLALSE